jgi:arylsulfatase A-like enzyme
VEREAVYAVGGYDPREPQAFEAGIQSGDDPLMGHYFEKLKLQQDDPTTVARAAMLRTREWKLIIRSAGKEELYDLENDPQELYNHIDDPALSEVRNNLRERLLHWYLRASDNPHWEHERSI